MGHGSSVLVKVLMAYQRFLFQASLFAALAGLGFLVAFGAEALCRAAWLPGDNAWTMRHLARLAFDGVLGAGAGNARYCAEASFGETLTDLTPWVLPVLAVFLAGQVLYESVRHSLRQRVMARRGGHALILGESADVAPLLNREKRSGPVLMLARDGAGLAALRRQFWSTPVVSAAGDPARLGAARARRIVAVSGSDVANLNFVESLRTTARGPLPGVVLRIENAAIRAAQKGSGGAELEEFSLDQALFRLGASLGDPADLFRAGTYPAHIVLIGAGGRLGELALHLAAFGYGLERAVPHITIIGLNASHPPAIIERLRRADGVAVVDYLGIDRADAVGLERVVAAVLAAGPPVAAIHCIDDQPGEAFAAAMMVAATITAVTPAHVPVVIAYGRAGEATPVAGLTGRVRFLAAEDLASALDAKDRRDQMAKAVHGAYLDLQRRTRGEAFGSEAAEKPWAELPMGYRDDNRAVADHIDHMLRAVGLGRRPVSGQPVAISPAQLESMAAMAHARWMAGKLLDGWRFAEKRDNARRLHPSLIPYEALVEAEKDKDRDQIRAIPHILAILGEELFARATPMAEI